MKKVLSIIFAIMFLAQVGCSGGFQGTSNVINHKDNHSNESETAENAGESGSESAYHVHSFSEWKVVKQSTCTEKGLKERTCSCGEKETKTIKAKGHNFGKWKTVIKATCTEKGQKERICECGEKETKEIKPKGHSFGKWTTSKKATCTETGIKERVCSCGEKEIKEIPATGHTFSEWKVVKKATCTEDGQKERKCKCGEKETKTIKAKGHDDQHGICSRCNLVSDSDKAGSYYLHGSAVGGYYSTYSGGSLYVKYHIMSPEFNYKYRGNGNGSLFLNINIQCHASVVSTGSYFGGTGFVDYSIYYNGELIKSGFVSIRGNYGGVVSCDAFLTLDKAEHASITVRFGDHYMY